MNKVCKVTFDQGDQKITVDFLVDDEGKFSTTINVEPEVTEQTKPGFAVLLYKIFIDALQEAGNDTELDKDETSESTKN